MAGTCKLLQVIHSSQIFLNLTEICHCIAAIRASLGSIQKWHKMNIIHIIFFQIIQFAFHAFHISGEIVNIEHHTQHIIFLVPVRICFSLLIKCFQRILTLLVEGLHLVTQFCKHGVISIKLHVKPAQFIHLFFKSDIIQAFGVCCYIFFLSAPLICHGQPPAYRFSPFVSIMFL